MRAEQLNNAFLFISGVYIKNNTSAMVSCPVCGRFVDALSNGPFYCSFCTKIVRDCSIVRCKVYSLSFITQNPELNIHK